MSPFHQNENNSLYIVERPRVETESAILVTSLVEFYVTRMRWNLTVVRGPYYGHPVGVMFQSLQGSIHILCKLLVSDFVLQNALSDPKQIRSIPRKGRQTRG